MRAALIECEKYDILDRGTLIVGGVYTPTNEFWNTLKFIIYEHIDR